MEQAPPLATDVAAVTTVDDHPSAIGNKAKFMKPQTVIQILKETFQEWNEDKVPLWAAALAYYTVFSLAPLLIIAIAIAGSVFGEEAARGEIVQQIQGLVGKEGAEAVQAMIQNVQRPGSGGTIATIFGVIALLFGASGVFGQLQEALNSIWEVRPKPRQALMGFLQSRFLSFASVLVIGFLLLVSLVLSAVLAGIGAYFGSLVPDAVIVARILNFAISFGVITLLIAAIYKFLPDVELRWKDLWIGAAVTSLLFSFGKYLIGLYLGNSGVTSTYGAAGSLVVILIWVFYSAQIILFGAEFTQVYSRHRGSGIRPSKHAVKIDKHGNEISETPVPTDVHHIQTNDAAIRSRHNSKPRYGQYLITALGSIVAIASLMKPRSRSRRRHRSS
jgi:membrane protein